MLLTRVLNQSFLIVSWKSFLPVSSSGVAGGRREEECVRRGQIARREIETEKADERERSDRQRVTDGDRSWIVETVAQADGFINKLATEPEQNFVLIYFKLSKSLKHDT